MPVRLHAQFYFTADGNDEGQSVFRHWSLMIVQPLWNYCMDVPFCSNRQQKINLFCRKNSIEILWCWVTENIDNLCLKNGALFLITVVDPVNHESILYYILDFKGILWKTSPISGSIKSTKNTACLYVTFRWWSTKSLLAVPKPDRCDLPRVLQWFWWWDSSLPGLWASHTMPCKNIHLSSWHYKKCVIVTYNLPIRVEWDLLEINCGWCVYKTHSHWHWKREKLTF